MLGHVSFGVRDLDAAMAFYDALLAPLGVTRVWSNPKGAGFRCVETGMARMGNLAMPPPSFQHIKLHHRVSSRFPRRGRPGPMNT